MLREPTVFGPIKSRRLGYSLGINLLPQNGKLCDFDCIYCECGWNADGRDDKVLPAASQVRSALEEKLAQCMLDGTRMDSITFAGDGEPTLHPDFPAIVDDVLTLRDIYYPSAKVSVLSNATRLSDGKVFEALKKVDNPIMKLDAPTDELVRRVNKPNAGYSVAEVVGNLARFEGDFILQTMFLKSRDFDSSSPEVIEGWMDIVRFLKPRQIMAYSIDRPTPQKGLVKFSESQIRNLVRPLLDEGFNIQIKA